jgi:heavy metal sensor kinase
MRSIRLTLIVYFLLLLAVGLVAVSIFAYQTTDQTLLANEKARKELLRAQHNERCRVIDEKLNTALLSRAHLLANQAGFLFQWTRDRYQRLYVLGLITASAQPHSHLFQPVWLAEMRSNSGPSSSGPLSGLVRVMMVTEIKLDEERLPPPEGGIAEFIQVNSGLSSEWRSRSMGLERFSFDVVRFAEIPLYDEVFDDTELTGVPLRRVTLRTPVAQTSDGPRDGPRGFPGRSPPRSNPSREARPTPTIVIQCAYDRTEHDATLTQLRADLDLKLAALEAESEDTLTWLRTRMCWIGLATFAATVLGGLWLVRVGLSPLQRLSEAVSQVSERDFRLPIDQRHLPRELRPIVERLTDTLDQLKRAFAREKQAAADISHELRTPLAALLTTIEVALRKPRPVEAYREVLADCLTTGQQISQLVERMLALARLDAGVDRVRAREVDVAALADQCAALVRPLADARQLQLRVARNGPTSLVADPDKLREVLTNLLHNAIEYNRPQGSVEVAVERQNGHVQLEVRDTGIGIAPQMREHIFERFFRADPSRQADGLHAGLGLAIVKGYIDLMGGTITVDSTEGQGSTFRVLLPAA